MFTKLACALFALAALGSQSPSAPSTSATIDEAAILTVVDRFMEAVSTNDMALMSALRFEGGFNVVERPAAGKTQLVRRVFDAASFKPGNYRERYWDPIVHVRGGIAVVWTPYEFWTDGKTSHCGIDVFDMAKQDGAWKISGMMWTVEPDSCPSLRPTDPSRVRPK